MDQPVKPLKAQVLNPQWGALGPTREEIQSPAHANGHGKFSPQGIACLVTELEPTLKKSVCHGVQVVKIIGPPYHKGICLHNFFPQGP